MKILRKSISTVRADASGRGVEVTVRQGEEPLVLRTATLPLLPRSKSMLSLSGSRKDGQEQ